MKNLATIIVLFCLSTVLLCAAMTKQTYVEPEYDFMLELTQDADSIDPEFFQEDEQEYAAN